MTLTQIQATVASIMGKTASDFTVNSFNLFLTAVNQVRRQAELLHDFEFSRKLVSVSVNGVTGGSLSSAVQYGTATAVDIKTVIEMGLFDEEANLRPVEWTTVAEGLERQRHDNGFTNPRYPTDQWYTSGPSGIARFEVAGDTIYRFPKDDSNNFTIGMEVYAFTPDWTMDSTEDNWMKYGHQFLIWASVIFLNHRFKTFVYRQEGNLPPPTALRDEGFQAFVEWDEHRFERNRRHGRV